jgi:hypothetical protein
MLTQCQKYGIPFTDRKEVKVGMFEVLFTKNRYRSNAKKLFNNLFPSVNKLFQIIKKDDHTLLPRLLQNIESFIVLQVITKRIARKYSTIPLFTIHDSIATTAEHGNKVAEIMDKELTTIIGIAPKLKMEQWSPEHLDWNKYACYNKELSAPLDV